MSTGGSINWVRKRERSPRGVRKFTPVERAAAVALSVEIGPARAAVRLNLNRSTLKAWRTAAGVDPAANPRSKLEQP